MNEKLQKYALIAEILGGIAVVVSLIYVGFQIQQNTTERRADSIESLNTGYREIALTYVEIKDAGVAWHKVLDGEELTKRDLDVMSDSLFAHLMLLEDTYNKHQQGYIDDEFLAARTSLEIMRVTLSPQLREVYESMKDEGIYTESFIRWFDEEIDKAGAG